MNSPVLRARVKPRIGAALYYDIARWLGIQTISGFVILGLYLGGEIGHQLASILIWVFAAGVLLIRQMLWVVGRNRDYQANMPTSKADLFARIFALPLIILGVAVHQQWI